MTRTRKEILKQLRTERERLRAENRQLFDEILHILFRHDPIGICYPSRRNSAEVYKSEVGTILPRLKEAHSVEDVRKILHEEFVFWFSPHLAGPEEKYQLIAVDVWAAYQRASRKEDLDG